MLVKEFVSLESAVVAILYRSGLTGLDSLNSEERMRSLDGKDLKEALNYQRQSGCSYQQS